LHKSRISILLAMAGLDPAIQRARVSGRINGFGAQTRAYWMTGSRVLRTRIP